MMRVIAVALAVALAGSLAAAQAIRPDDQARLDRLDTAMGQALRRVLALGSDEEVATALDLHAQCTAHGEWPCLHPAQLVATLPAYALA